MQKFLSLSCVAGFLALTALFSSRPALAAEGPWCAVVNMGFGMIRERCSMTSFEMCLQEALRFGMTSFCRQNPAYPGYWSVQRESHPTKSRRRHHRR